MLRRQALYGVPLILGILILGIVAMCRRNGTERKPTIPATPADQDEPVALKIACTKGNRFVVTTELEFVEDPDFKLIGSATLKASLDCVVDEGEGGALTYTFSFRELSGKGKAVKVDGTRWSYDLQWKAGSDWRKTFISCNTAADAENAARDLEDAFKVKWTATQNNSQAGLTGNIAKFSFLKSWMPSLFLMPGQLPFRERKVKKGDTFDEAGLVWTADAVSIGKDGVAIASLTGETKGEAQPRKVIRLKVDSRGYLAALTIEQFDKGAEKPSLRLQGLIERP